MSPFGLILLTLVTLMPLSTQAYIGPGLSGGTLGLILGFLISILLAVLALLWFPLKRLFGRWRREDKPR